MELVIGADLCGQLFSGLIHLLECGLIAYETYIGWVLINRTSNNIKSTSHSNVIESIPLLTHSEKIEQFWDLELIEIRKSAEKTTREEVEKLFNDTLFTDFDGRYMMRLPWIDNSCLPDSKNIAEKRLLATTTKLISTDILISIQFLKVGKVSRSLKRFLKVEGKEGVIIFLIVELLKNAR
ncbi:uncharacterized protein TNCT_386111 [Trichonephila clavata]|uniref:Uncharacterized protein n=1 Tax=Trichonephila clavata TaxID=2740835 RepID=A0A8X6F0Y6_TRICU|nr:uncharacterized protein TNCT_386111 [Trichonephila clavata]